MAFVITLSQETTDTTLPRPGRDAVEAADATAFVYDAGKAYSWASQAAPTNGAAVNDLSREAANASFVTSGTGPTFAGEGFDFAGVTAAASHMVQTPTTVLVDIAAATNQYWASCQYYKLPLEADWPSSQGVIGSYTSAAAMNTAGLFQLEMHVNGANDVMIARIGRTGATSTALESATGALAPFYGTVTQILVWRDATGIHMRLKNATNEYTINGAVGSKNTDTIGGKYGAFGVLPFLRPTGNARNFRFYRAWLENLDASLRTATTVADADWTRNGPRFS